jgi:hypothetical protein
MPKKAQIKISMPQLSPKIDRFSGSGLLGCVALAEGAEVRGRIFRFWAGFGAASARFSAL